MRVLASLFKEKNAFIPDEKREELADRIEKLYQAGGMMEVEVVSLFGKEVATIRKAGMNKDGMFFFYNYFEDDYWEDAGFDRESGCVLSGNIGLGLFYKVVVAAYVLEAIYTQGGALAMVDKEPVDSWRYIGWINYLFGEKYSVTNFEPRELCETIHYEASAKAIEGSRQYYVKPVSTADFMKISPDERIPYWEENGDFEFSKGLWAWFGVLKGRYDRVMSTDFFVEKPLEYVLNLMQEADEEYYGIYTFAEFWEETVEHIEDKRYLTLWKLYEEMLRAAGRGEMGDDIPDSDGPEAAEVYYGREHMIVPLRGDAEIVNFEKRNSKVRVAFRRYMALVANKELRSKVFGF